MRLARSSFITWLEGLVAQTSVSTVVIEDDQPFAPPQWSVNFLSEGDGYAGRWSGLVQIDYYRTDGDTNLAGSDTDVLLRAMGLAANPAIAIATLPLLDASANPTPSVVNVRLFKGKGWQRVKPVVPAPLDRHFMLTLELRYPLLA